MPTRCSNRLLVQLELHDPMFMYISECDFDDCANECLVARILNARKIVMWFFKWNIALVGFRLFTSRRCSLSREIFFCLLFFGFCLFFLPVGCKTSSLIYFTLAYSSSRSMQMIGDCRTVSLGKCGKTTQWHQVWVSGAVHWFTPIINEADGTYSHSHPPNNHKYKQKNICRFLCCLCVVCYFWILYIGFSEAWVFTR